MDGKFKLQYKRFAAPGDWQYMDASYQPLCDEDVMRAYNSAHHKVPINYMVRIVEVTIVKASFTVFYSLLGKTEEFNAGTFNTEAGALRGALRYSQEGYSVRIEENKEIEEVRVL